MRWDRTRVKHFEAVHLQQMLETADGIVTQVLVINGVVLQPVEQPNQVVRLGDEHAVGRKHLQNAIDDGMHVLDMGKAIGGGDDLGGAMLGLDLLRHLLAEIALDGRDAAVIGDFGHIGRLDAKDAMAALLEIRNQRAVVGADIDDQVILAEREHLGRLGVKLGEIVAQHLGHATGVGIFRREDDDRIDRKPELHQLAVADNRAGWSETTATGAAAAPTGTIWLTGGM